MAKFQVRILGSVYFIYHICYIVWLILHITATIDSIRYNIHVKVDVIWDTWKYIKMHQKMKKIKKLPKYEMVMFFDANESQQASKWCFLMFFDANESR